MFTLEWVLAVTGGTFRAGRNDVSVFNDIVIDTRKISGPGSLFIALRGPNFDGHQFVQAAHTQGSAALVQRGRISTANGPLIEVEDTLKALQDLAEAWRESFQIPVIGITGSNGKTIVKEMLASILARHHTVHRSPGSFNSQVGVALSLLGIRPEHECAIIEAGISEIGEMAKLQAMIKPTHGILTTIGAAHSAGLHTLANTTTEKLQLFERAQKVVLPDMEIVRKHAQMQVAVWFSAEVRHPAHEDVHVYCERFEQDELGGNMSFVIHDEVLNTHLNTPGLHNVSNALAAAAMANILGMNHADITEGLSVFELAPMRLEMHTTMSGITLINDAYSSDPVSARSALATLQHYSQGTRSVAILGDMLDLGTLSVEAHRELGKDVVAFKASQLVTLGPLSLNTAAAAAQAGLKPEQITRCQTLDELSEFLETLLEPGDVVLFKGSRAMQLDRAAERLLESVAPTRLYVDLDAIRQNVQALKHHLHGTRLMAVVKSFAYGNDATRVSQTLVREGIDALAVAYADEAIPLRRRGLKVPILVTNTLAPEADKIVKYDLTALISSTETLDALQRHAARRNVQVHVHIEVDSGMGRVGLLPRDVLGFAKKILTHPNVVLEGLMTHFASADDASQDDFTRQQIARFQGVVQELAAAGIHPPILHAANTAGAWRFPESHYDMVRVGLGLYGFHPSNEVAPFASATRPALKFATQIIHIKEVHAGDSISYGRTWISADTRRIATLAVGYNDGFARFMSNGGEVLVGGVRCPVVGTVCMDVCMVDVTAVPEAVVGDEVVLFGTQGSAQISVEEMATRGNTINYEILCKISPRVRRIFLQ